MAIFNSYVKLPEGNHGKCAKIIENDHWGYPFMTTPRSLLTKTQKNGMNDHDPTSWVNPMLQYMGSSRSDGKIHWLKQRWDSEVLSPGLCPFLDIVGVWLSMTHTVWTDQKPSIHLVGGFKHFSILRIIIPSDFHIFKRGSSHQPVFGFVIFKPLPLPLETSSYPKGWWHSISSSRKNLACNNSWVHTTYNMIYQVPEKNIQLLTRYTLGC